MAKKRKKSSGVKATSFRLPEDYLLRLDRIRKRESLRTGWSLTRTDILKKLIDSEEFVFLVSRLSEKAPQEKPTKSRKPAPAPEIDVDKDLPEERVGIYDKQGNPIK